MSIAPDSKTPLTPAIPTELLRLPVGVASPLWGLFAGAAVTTFLKGEQDAGVPEHPIDIAACSGNDQVQALVAHEAARRLYPSPTAVWLSQLPLLMLMMAFTVFGLWILAQPLGADVLR